MNISTHFEVTFSDNKNSKTTFLNLSWSLSDCYVYAKYHSKM